ncbi:hypothetical protein SO802_026314 [Lithocarpus litseifolius]|uniref:Uncharacterized protein n=1 Tax=Lithocarpus litseifolius TaxID=425828 RepID=A0AAW2BZD5_9ROSI
MMTRFSKQKLAKAQEKKAKGGIVSGLLSKKRSKAGDVSKEDPVITLSPAHSLAKRPASPTLSLEEDANAAALKAHEALSVDDLSPLMAKSSSEVMLSHIQKLVQALGESLFVSIKLLDLERKVATSEPMIKSLSTENKTFKNKVAILTVEVEKDKEYVAVLEKSLHVEKDFCKLKDKQIGDLKLKLQKAEAMAVKEFKDSNEYSDELCGYYVEGFDLLRKWMAKHHPDMDLFGLVMGEVEKELLADHPFEATSENMMEEATDIAEVMEETAVTTPIDPVPNKQ